MSAVARFCPIGAAATFATAKTPVRRVMLCLACLLGVARAQAESEVTPIAFPTVHVNGPAMLRDWLVLGPFTSTRIASPHDRDFLAEIGAPETAIRTSDALLAVARKLPHADTVADPDTPRYASAQTDILDFQQLFNRPYSAKVSKTAAYVACELIAERSQQIWLLQGTCDLAKVWLNGEPVADIALTDRRPLHAYDEAIALPLAKGRNLLLIKVSRLAHSWKITSRIELDAKAAAASALRSQGKAEAVLLANTVIPLKEPLHLDIRGAPKDVEYEAQVFDADGTVIRKFRLRNGQLCPSTQNLDTGLYRLVLEDQGKTFFENFCVGEPLAIADRLRPQIAPLTGDERTKLNVEALWRRLDILSRPENRVFKVPMDAREWSRKAVFAVSELQDMLQRLAAGRPAATDVSGLHIRGFRSKIDDQPQYYRLFVPSSYDRGGPGLPLVVIAPPEVGTNRPFIEGPIIAGHGAAEELGALAEKAGLALLWIGYRNSPSGQPCEFTHFEEVLSEVARDYKLDYNRIYLAAVCGGGVWTGMMAVRWPERFAALGLLHPILHRSSNGDGILAESAACPDYLKWIAANDPFSRLMSVPDLPIYIIHDGAADGHGDIECSLELLYKAEPLHLPIRFEQTGQTLGENNGAWDSLFGWMASQRREKSSPRLVLDHLRALTTVGPVSTALADEFWVVEGTKGSPAELAAIKAIRDRFLQQWRNTHFGECRVVTDENVPELGEPNCNLVLIGNERTNQVWHRFSHALPVQCGTNEIRLGPHSIPGKSLAVQAIVAHPRAPNRRVVVIGAEDLEHAVFGTQNLSVDGWFDFAIWESNAGAAKLVRAGFYQSLRTFGALAELQKQ